MRISDWSSDVCSSDLGLDSSDATLQEESVKLVAAISSSRAREFMETKDYKGLIASLEQSGVLTGFRSTALQQRLEFVLKENGDEFRRIVADGVAGSTPSERDALLRDRKSTRLNSSH